MNRLATNTRQLQLLEGYCHPIQVRRFFTDLSSTSISRQGSVPLPCLLLIRSLSAPINTATCLSRMPYYAGELLLPWTIAANDDKYHNTHNVR